MTITPRLSVAAPAVQQKLIDNAAALGISQVFYGDQDRIAQTPTVCVEPDAKANSLKAAARVVDIDLRIYIIVYTARIESGQLNRLDSDTLAEDIEDLFHADWTLGGLVTHSYISDISSGYVRKANSVMRASRLTWLGTSQNQLPSEFYTPS